MIFSTTNPDGMIHIDEADEQFSNWLSGQKVVYDDVNGLWDGEYIEGDCYNKAYLCCIEPIKKDCELGLEESIELIEKHLPELRSKTTRGTVYVDIKKAVSYLRSKLEVVE